MNTYLQRLQWRTVSLVSGAISLAEWSHYSINPAARFPLISTYEAYPAIHDLRLLLLIHYALAGPCTVG